MTAAPAIKEERVDLLDCFRERVEAKAYLVLIGELELIAAVDELHAAAIRDGLIDRIGVDGIQAILADCFGRIRGGELEQ
jgi:hypothetical protein